MGFWNTVHEQNVHFSTIEGKVVSVCHQLDDFAFGAESPDTAELLITKIRECVQAERGWALKLKKIPIFLLSPSSSEMS